MRTLNLPASWDRMGFCAKAGYLAASNQAKSFADACSMLAKMRKPKVVQPPVRQAPLWYQKEN